MVEDRFSTRRFVAILENKLHVFAARLTEASVLLAPLAFSFKKSQLYFSRKLPTYPSPKWEVSVNVGLGEGLVGSFPETCNDPYVLVCF